MSRYIDADNLYKVKYHNLPYTHIVPSNENVESYERGWNDAIDAIIENEPSADVRENVKGEWKMINEQLAKCSVCGGYESTNGKDKTGKGVIFKMQKKYCPHCGARMVEE